MRFERLFQLTLFAATIFTLTGCPSETTNSSTDTSCAAADSTSGDSTAQWKCEEKIRIGDMFKCQWSATYYYVDNSWSSKNGGVTFTVKETYYKTIAEKSDYVFNDGDPLNGDEGAACNHDKVTYHPETNKVTWIETWEPAKSPANNDTPKKMVTDWTCDWSPAKK